MEAPYTSIPGQDIFFYLLGRNSPLKKEIDEGDLFFEAPKLEVIIKLVTKPCDMYLNVS